MAKLINEENLKLGAVVGLASMLLAYVFSTLLKGFGATITFAAYDINVRQQLEAGISTGAAEKILNTISGILPMTLPNLIYVFLAGFLIVIVGKLVVNLLNLKVKDKLWLIMLTGTVAISALVNGMSVLNLGFIATLVGMGIYFAIVSFAIGMLIKYKVVPSSWAKI